MIFRGVFAAAWMAHRRGRGIDAMLQAGSTATKKPAQAGFCYQF
jgi:hypothetical protein